MSDSDLVKFLENYLSERSYIEGYQPSQADLKTIGAIKSAPADKTPNLLRWYKHIQSFSSEERKHFGETPVNSLIDNLISNSGNAKQESKSDDKAEDDDVDLFGSDEEEDPEAERIKEERLKAYAEKKSKKPAIVAKSSIILDVKPWGDDTDMTALETSVRSIEMDGLLWGASKLVPVGYGIKKLQIMCVVEDEKVSVDDLTEKIQDFEEYVQSIDIAAFNKI